MGAIVTITVIFSNSVKEKQWFPLTKRRLLCSTKSVERELGKIYTRNHS